MKLNYKKALRQPIVFQKLFKNFSLYRPVLLSSVGVFCLTAFLMATVFRFITNFLMLLPPGWLLAYGVIPFLVTTWIAGFETDGKSFVFYVYDLIGYYMRHGIKKQDTMFGREVVKNSDERLVFEKMNE